MLGTLLLSAIAAGTGLALGGLLRGAPRPRMAIARWVRRTAAAIASVVAVAFAAGVIGLLSRSGPVPVAVPTIVVFALALLGAALLLWRGPSTHLGVAGHWLGALWWMLSALRTGNPVLHLMFAPVAVLGLLAAGLESVGTPEPEAPAPQTRHPRRL